MVIFEELRAMSAWLSICVFASLIAYIVFAIKAAKNKEENKGTKLKTWFVLLSLGIIWMLNNL